MNPNMTNLLRSAAFGALLLTGTGTYAYDADTLAFYPFVDRSVGTSSLNMTITNAVNDTLYGGNSTHYGTWAGNLKFSDDVPGRYLFEGGGYHSSCYAQDFGSIHVTGRMTEAANPTPMLAESSGNIAFTNLASVLSKVDSWTIEFFYKVPANDIMSNLNLMGFAAGFASGSDKSPGELILKQTDNNSGNNKIYYRAFINDAVSGYVFPDYIGVWHHYALVCTDGVITFYCDYDLKATFTAVKKGETEDMPLNLFKKSARGYLAGLRVMQRAVAPDKMLRASDCPTGVPATAFQWSLEGTAGEIPSGDMLVAVSDSAGTQPLLAERRNGTVYENGEKVRETLTAVSLTGVPKTGSSIYGSGNCIMVPKDSMEAVIGDFTMEGWFKFDHKTWRAKYAEGENRPYVGIFWQDWYVDHSSGRTFIWSLQFLKSNDRFYPRIQGYYTDWTGFLFEDFTTPIKADGKWHHYAITYDYSEKTFEVFEDGVSLGTRTLTMQLILSAQTTYNKGLNYDLMVGYGKACQPFEGQVDEVRYSRKVLTPSEFISIDDRQGLMLLFR